MTIVYNKQSSMTSTGGHNNSNLRTVFSTSVLGAATGNQIRVTFYWLSADSNSYVVGPVYAGQQGAAAPNFTGNQAQIKFSGSATFNPPTAGGLIVSDWATLGETYDNTKPYVVAFWVGPVGGSSQVHFNSGISGVNTWNDDTTGSATSSTTTPGANMVDTGFGANWAWAISELEIQPSGGGGGSIVSVAASRTIFRSPKLKFWSR